MPAFAELQLKTGCAANTDGMPQNPGHQPLVGRVAVVAGATRGAGRGIAAALGEAGATVVCTGRSSVTGALQSDYDRPETIEQTAQLVTDLGGVGVAVPTDHLDIAQVRTLADFVRREYGVIDILVNDVWGAEILKGPPASWNRPMWEHDLEDGLRILSLGVDTHLVTSHCLLPLLASRPGGLLVEVTDGTAEYNACHYRVSVFYDLAKVSVNRLAFSQGEDLAAFGCTAVAVTPGWLRSEMMLDNYRVTEADWTSAMSPDRGDGYPIAPPGFADSETPRFVGRGVAAIAADVDRARWNQRSMSSAELARVYGFTDTDGRLPDAWTPV
jgi:NAD(P)-dependent dehydrogenase (short-subunit alcohol dehydrogenase family)